MNKPEVIVKRMVSNLKARRKDAKVSQQKMGKILGVHQSAVSRIEKGEQQLSVVQVVRLCQLYGVTFEEFCS